MLCFCFRNTRKFSHLLLILSNTFNEPVPWDLYTCCFLYLECSSLLLCPSSNVFLLLQSWLKLFLRNLSKPTSLKSNPTFPTFITTQFKLLLFILRVPSLLHNVHHGCEHQFNVYFPHYSLSLMRAGHVSILFSIVFSVSGTVPST